MRQPQPKHSHELGNLKGKQVAIQSSELEAEPLKPIILGTSVSKEPTASVLAQKSHKCYVKNSKKAMSTKTGTMPDPSQGMATAFVEEALSPGSSSHYSRAAEPNIHLPQPISQLEPSSFIGHTLHGLSKGDPDSLGGSSPSEDGHAPPHMGPLKHCHCAKCSKWSSSSSPSSLSSSDSEGAGGSGGSLSPSDSDS